MPSSEDTTQADFFDDTSWMTDELADVDKKTDALIVPEQRTEALPPLSSEVDQDQVRQGRRSHVAKQQAGMRPFFSSGTSTTRGAWRTIAQLREENTHLRHDLAEQSQELQRLIAAYTSLQVEHEHIITTIYEGHQQDLAHYQTHLKEAIEERNRLQEACSYLEQNYEQLYHTFQVAVEQELQKRLTEATYALQTSPDTVPSILQDAARIFESKSRQLEEKYLVEALFLKREIQFLATRLQEERQQIAQERQRLLAMYHTACEQVQLYQETAKVRLRSRWRIASLSIAVGLLALLVIMQFVFLYVLHARLTASVSFSLLAPILLCIVLAFTFSRPAQMVKHMYFGAPHKKKVKR